MLTTLAATATAAVLIVMSGCAVTRGQESVGAYVDDTAITTAVTARFVDNKQVDASSIQVETLNGTVMLSGFAKHTIERTTAETLTPQGRGSEVGQKRNRSAPMTLHNDIESLRNLLRTRESWKAGHPYPSDASRLPIAVAGTSMA